MGSKEEHKNMGWGEKKIKSQFVSVNVLYYSYLSLSVLIIFHGLCWDPVRTFLF